MFYDLARDKLYVGTANGADPGGRGHRHRIRVDTPPPDRRRARVCDRLLDGRRHRRRPDGRLLVVDDPALLEPAEPLGTGRMFQVGLPAAHVTPARRTPRNAKPRVPLARRRRARVPPEAGRRSSGWDDCADTFTPEDELDDGAYMLTVRATGGGVTGLPESHRFTVDTTAPLAPGSCRPDRRCDRRPLPVVRVPLRGATRRSSARSTTASSRRASRAAPPPTPRPARTHCASPPSIARATSATPPRW